MFVDGLYLEMMDGEFLKISSGQEVTITPDIKFLSTRYLKTMALFGYGIVLSDVQLTDSGLWLDLIAGDQEKGEDSILPFLRNSWIRYDKGFVQLRSRQDSDCRSGHYSRVTSGLRRTESDAWVSSAFYNTNVLKEVSQEILKHGESILDFEVAKKNGIPDEIEKLIKRSDHANDQKRYKALLKSLQLFLSIPKSSEEPRGQSHNYNEVIDQLVGTDIQHNPYYENAHDNYHLLEKLQKEIHSIEVTDRGYRSALLKRLTLDSGDPEHKFFWNTTIHAWNYTNFRSLCNKDEGMAMACLNPELELHAGRCLLPLEAEMAPMDLTRKLKKTDFPPVLLRSTGGGILALSDPGQLTWDKIRTLTSETDELRDELISSRKDSAEEHELSARKLCSSLAKKCGAEVTANFIGAAIAVGGIKFPILSIIGAAITIKNYAKYKWMATGFKRAYNDVSKKNSEA